MYNNFIARAAQNKKLHEKFIRHGIVLSESVGYTSQLFQVFTANVPVIRSGMRNGFMVIGCGLHRAKQKPAFVMVRHSHMLADGMPLAEAYTDHLQSIKVTDWQKLVDALESDYVGIGYDVGKQALLLLPVAIVAAAAEDTFVAAA